MSHEALLKEDTQRPTVPFQITFRDMEGSPSVWLAIQKRIGKLEQFFDRIVRCEVVVSTPHRHHRKGRIRHIQVHLQLPGHDIYINREPEIKSAHFDIYVAVRDAFDTLDRKLEDYVRKMRRTDIAL